MITMYTEDEPAQKKRREKKGEQQKEEGREVGTGQADTGVDRERQAGR